MIKVLQVVGRMDYGGTETLLMNLLRVLDQNSIQYDFVAQTPEECAYDQEIYSYGAKIYRCPHISWRNLKSYREWWQKFFLEHPEYLIVHGHSRGSAPIYLDEAKKAGRIAILHCHSGSYGLGVKGLVRFLWQLPLYHISNYKFACSYDAGVSQFGKKSKFYVIKNGISSERYVYNPEIRKKVRDEFHFHGKLVIGNVSRFESPKNHEFLLEIFKEILKIEPNAVLMLVGTGSKKERIEEIAKTSGIEDKVCFTGARNDVNELLQGMDIFVFPSLYEGLPLALIESQAAGLPTFTSAKVVAPEVKITDILHFISLKRTAKEWARIIMKTVRDGSERRDMSKEVIEAGFDIRNTQKWLEDFYYKAVRDAGR